MAETRAHHWKRLARHLWREVARDHVSNGAAALAFFMVLALFPAAIFGLGLLPYLPIPHLREAIMDLARQALPGSAADLLTTTVDSVLSKGGGGLLSFGFLFAIWSASSGLLAVMEQLNVVFEVKEERSFLRARAVSLLLTICFFVLVVGALALVVFGGMLQGYIGDHLGWSAALRTTFSVIRWVIIVGALHLTFSLVYHLGPNVDRKYVFVTAGSVFATVALLLTSFLFKLYVSNFANYGALYGSLGAVIVLLLWLYVTGWVILLGGEINDIVQRKDEHEQRTRREEHPGLVEQHA